MEKMGLREFLLQTKNINLKEVSGRFYKSEVPTSNLRKAKEVNKVTCLF